MSLFRGNKEIIEIHHGQYVVTQIYRGSTLVWDSVSGFAFSSDGFVVQTSDGYIEQFNDQ